MKLQSLIDKHASEVAEVAPPPKTASAAPQGASLPAIDAAVGAALQDLGGYKQAAQAAPPTGPVDALRKLAEDQLETEKQAEAQHAYLLGVAMSDGFAAGLAQHQQAAAKVAAEGGAPGGATAEDLALVKLAREDPEEFLRWVQQGYDAQVASTKQAEAEAYDETYDRTVRAIHKVASDHYLEGYRVADALLREAAAGG